jgi:DNA-binding NarL/FixJ family response regulator
MSPTSSERSSRHGPQYAMGNSLPRRRRASARQMRRAGVTSFARTNYPWPEASRGVHWAYVPWQPPIIRRLALDEKVEVVVVETASPRVDVSLLTEDEEEVALLIAAGKDARSIARLRGTPVETVLEQRAAIYAKLEVPNPKALAAKLFG